MDYMTCLPLSSARIAIRQERFLAGWPLAREFVSAWTTKGGILGKTVPNIWLSFDLEKGAERWPQPSVLIRIREGNVCSPERLTDEIFRILGNAFPTAAKEGVHALLDSLPAAARVLHLSLMPGRTPPAVKINLRLPRKDLPSLLSRGGWRGSSRDLARVLDSGLLSSRILKMQVTVGGSLHPKLEFETQFSRSKSRPDLGRWLQRCAEMRICDPGKLAEVSSWPGYTFGRTKGDNRCRLVERRLDMKLIVGAGPDLRIKAYLGMAHASGRKEEVLHGNGS